MYKIMLSFLIVMILLSSCQSQGRLNKAEKYYDTDGAINKFHDLAVKKDFSKCGFDGVVLGFEKIDHSRARSNRKKFRFEDVQRIYDMEIDSHFIKKRRYHHLSYAKSILNHPKQIVLSHMLKSKDNKIEVDYNIYDQSLHKKKQDYDLYEATKIQLDELSEYIGDHIGEYTHVLLMSTGWNNDQYNSLEFYSEWHKQLTTLANEEKTEFKPFIIGLTWPSFWGERVMIDMPNKANDADELGMTHLNYFLWQCLMKNPKISSKKIVLIGHSLGARILTRAAYAYIYFDDPEIERKVDYIFVLQGAYQIDRHLIEGGQFKSVNKELYTESDPTNHFIATTSKHDKAMNSAKTLGFGTYIGDDQSWRRVKKHKGEEFRMNKVNAQGLFIDNYSPHKNEILNCDEMIDAHGDVRDKDICRLVWNYMFQEVKSENR